MPNLRFLIGALFFTALLLKVWLFDEPVALVHDLIEVERVLVVHIMIYFSSLLDGLRSDVTHTLLVKSIGLLYQNICSTANAISHAVPKFIISHYFLQ
jgi:hypothetical protein